MQPLSNKRSKSIFNLKKISGKGIKVKLIFNRKINSISLMLN
jgi:hypothetical protein